MDWGRPELAGLGWNVLEWNDIAGMGQSMPE